MAKDRSRRGFLDWVRSDVPREDLHLLRVGRPAMGTLFEILFPSRDRELIEAAHRALDEIRRLESILTVYDEESLISRVNQSSAGDLVAVTDEVFQLLRRSQKISVRTGGAFDITSGPLWRCWGFFRGRGAVPAAEDLEKARARTGFRNLILAADARLVGFREEGMEINLGSIGKGFALDRAASILQNAGLEKALLHAGHSSFLALGAPAESHAGWRVSLQHPLSREMDLGFLELNGLAMATSGSGEQFFEVEGRRYGHILDPRTGESADLHWSTTVVAPKAEIADALATAFFVMPLNEIEAFCDRHPELGAIVVPRAERPSAEREGRKSIVLGRASEHYRDFS